MTTKCCICDARLPDYCGDNCPSCDERAKVKATYTRLTPTERDRIIQSAADKLRKHQTFDDAAYFAAVRWIGEERAEGLTRRNLNALAEAVRKETRSRELESVWV